MRILQLTLLLLGGLCWQIAPAALSNQLKDNPSPYLALHSKDPIAWQTWSPETLALARRENKLLFVSVGYFSCYWCHVMQRESFADAAIADALNQHFVPVKVDRELNAALDAYLMNFMERTSGQGGWPLNVFVTPDGNPVVGSLYLPRDQLQMLLGKVNNLWQHKNAYLRDMAAKAALQLSAEPAHVRALAPDAGQHYLDAFVQQAMANADDLAGGFGDQSKFPMIDQLRVLLDFYQGLSVQRQKGQQQVADFLQTTLDHMATQGLRDQLGGGFFRYTTDPNWQTPHYEKMLYDNARLASLYLDAAQVFQRKDYRAIGRETLNFMIRELMTPEGGMVSSLSAVDGANVEGGYYLWSKATLQSLLTPQEFKVMALLWNLDRATDGEAGYLPKQLMAPNAVAQQLGQPTDKVMGLIAQAQGKLFKARRQRTLPVDTKQLASWNGLALAAMAHGTQLNKGEKYRDAAMKLRNYLVTHLWDGKRLSRAVDKRADEKRVSVGAAGLEDYAYAALGLYDWGKVSGDRKDLPLVRQWLGFAWQHFYTVSGWVNSDAMLIKAGPAVPVMDDGALPSPSSILLRVSWRMAVMDHDTKRKQQVIEALGRGQELLQQQPFYYANQIALMAEVQNDVTIEGIESAGKNRK